jgi:hypothetical protein
MTHHLPFQWDGTAMIPARGFAKRADQLFVIGQTYNLAEHLDRSSATHAHYFAALNEAWQSLPEHLAIQFPSVEKLRKHALIRTGYCDSHSIVCSSKAEARRVAAFMQPIDEFAVVEVHGAVVTRYVAKSQKYGAMDRREFQVSKEAVLNWVDDILGVARGELARTA